jgi:hypothetical protein
MESDLCTCNSQRINTIVQQGIDADGTLDGVILRRLIAFRVEMPQAFLQGERVGQRDLSGCVSLCVLSCSVSFRILRLSMFHILWRAAGTLWTMDEMIHNAPVNCKSLIYLLSFRRLHTSPT